MQKILITGAGGFIGSHTTDFLLASGKQVIGVDNFSTGNRDNLIEASKSDQFTLIEGDITEPGVIETAVASHKPDSIIHLAALVSVPAGEEDPGEARRGPAGPPGGSGAVHGPDRCRRLLSPGGAVT